MTEAGLVRFSVRDEGPGIAKEQLEIIFERFIQAEMGYSRRHGGVGLGLAISKAIVEQMNGRIRVASTLGEGAEFWFELPLEAKQSINHVTKVASA